MWQALFSGACHGEGFDRLVLRASCLVLVIVADQWAIRFGPFQAKRRHGRQSRLQRAGAIVPAASGSRSDRRARIGATKRPSAAACGIRCAAACGIRSSAITFDTMGAHIRKCPHNRLTLVAAGFLRWNATVRPDGSAMKAGRRDIAPRADRKTPAGKREYPAAADRSGGAARAQRWRRRPPTSARQC